MSLEEFITATEITFEKLLTAFGSVPPLLLAVPMQPGRGSACDLAEHLMEWDTLALRALETVYAGDPLPDFPTEDVEPMQTKSARKPERVLNELRITHSAVMEALNRVPREKLCPNDEVPEWLRRFTLEHYAHHVPQLEEWVGRMKEGS